MFEDPNRLEMQVALASLLDRFPDLALAVPDDEVPWKDGSAVWGLQHLPITFWRAGPCAHHAALILRADPQG